MSPSSMSATISSRRRRFFFCSSRRRHTRFKCDWSSDVCSSDLCWLHGMLKVSKRYLLQVAARNLGLIMRKLFGMGTPRGLQKEGGATSPAYLLMLTLWRALQPIRKLVVAFDIAALPNEPRPRAPAPAT